MEGNERNLLSFEVILTDTGPIEPNDDFAYPKLLKAIQMQVSKDGIRKDAVLPIETPARVARDAAEVIYFDVAEFFYWYFAPEDDRAKFVTGQKQAAIPAALRAIVKPVVDYVLDDMRESDLIPEGLDVNGLDEIVTDNLSRYVINWQDWYYDRKAQDDLDDTEFDKALYNEIYVDSDYGDFSNLSNYTDGDIDDPYEDVR